MKTNVPEKIYIQPNAKDGWFASNPHSNIFVEYIRKDAFIEKACAYLDENCRRFILTEKDIDDFRNYMKGE